MTTLHLALSPHVHTNVWLSNLDHTLYPSKNTLSSLFFSLSKPKLHVIDQFLAFFESRKIVVIVAIVMTTTSL
jgi:hypothetical protein